MFGKTANSRKSPKCGFMETLRKTITTKHRTVARFADPLDVNAPLIHEWPGTIRPWSGLCWELCCPKRPLYYNAAQSLITVPLFTTFQLLTLNSASD